MNKIQGQRSREEFARQYGANHQGHAIIKYGKYTYNYWTQHSDGSWTNYDCKSVNTDSYNTIQSTTARNDNPFY